MTADPVRRIENRRNIIASLRSCADTAEVTAAELRAKADRLEASTDALEGTGGATADGLRAKADRMRLITAALVAGDDDE